MSEIKCKWIEGTRNKKTGILSIPTKCSELKCKGIFISMKEMIEFCEVAQPKEMIDYGNTKTR